MPITKSPIPEFKRKQKESVIREAIPPEGTRYKMRTYFPGKRSPMEQFFKTFDDLLRERKRREKQHGEQKIRVYPV